MILRAGQNKDLLVRRNILSFDGHSIHRRIVLVVSGNITLEKLETETREARRGLSADDPQPVPP